MVVSACSVADICGGCPLLGWETRAELEFKRALVEHALLNANVAFPKPRWVRVGQRLGYRNRVRLRVGADGRVDFFNPNKAHACPVLEPDLEALVSRVRSFAEEQHEYLAAFAHLEVRAPDADGHGGICFYRKDEAAAIQARVLTALVEIGDDVLVSVHGNDPGARVPNQRRVLDRDVYCYVPLDAFMQVNTAVNRALVQTLRRLAAGHGITSFAELYAGSGNLSLPLMKDRAVGVAVEASSSAIHGFRLAALEQELSGTEIEVGDAALAAEQWLREGRRWELLILDAPRSGVRFGLETMLRLAQRQIAVLSCNPRTLARDLSVICRRDFALRELFLFDMFPETRHVEVLAWLERRSQS